MTTTYTKRCNPGERKGRVQRCNGVSDWEMEEADRATISAIRRVTKSRKANERKHLRGDAVIMTTYSGRRLHPFEPLPCDIEITDIAHVLSNVCRWGGHVSRFYSVGQHSLYVSQLVAKQHKLQALLHDATEAYLGDMIRPLKYAQPWFRELEAKWWAAICQRFDIPIKIHQSIKDADNTMLVTERRDLRANTPEIICAREKTFRPAKFRIEILPPEEVKARFLDTFNRLTK